MHDRTRALQNPVLVTCVGRRRSSLQAGPAGRTSQGSSISEGIGPMRIGLLADIHEDVEGLEASITRCRREGVDRLVTLGDIFETGEHFADAVDLLRDADVSGVWGNHEFALYAGRGDSVESQFDWRTLDYMKRLTARHEVEGVLFGHVLPCLDPTDIQQPWYVERATLDRPGGRSQLRRVFSPANVRRPLSSVARRHAGRSARLAGRSSVSA